MKYTLDISRAGLSIIGEDSRSIAHTHWYAYSSAAKTVEDILDGVGFDYRAGARQEAIEGNKRQLEAWRKMHAALEPVETVKPIKELCLYTLADGRTLVQDRACNLPAHTFQDEHTARTFALGMLYGMNPRALPEQLKVQKINN